MGKIISNLTEMNATEVADDDLVAIEDISAPKTKSLSISEMITRFKTGISAIAGLIKPYHLNYSDHAFFVTMNNGTGSRTTTTSTSMVNLSTPYTYTNSTTYSQVLEFDYTVMCSGSGITEVMMYASVNGGAYATAAAEAYFNIGTAWSVQTRQGRIIVPAGGTCVLQPRWKTNTGTATCTNATTDSQFAPTLRGRIYRDDS